VQLRNRINTLIDAHQAIGLHSDLSPHPREAEIDELTRDIARIQVDAIAAELEYERASRRATTQPLPHRLWTALWDWSEVNKNVAGELLQALNVALQDNFLHDDPGLTPDQEDRVDAADRSVRAAQQAQRNWEAEMRVKDGEESGEPSRQRRRIHVPQVPFDVPFGSIRVPIDAEIENQAAMMDEIGVSEEQSHAWEEQQQHAQLFGADAVNEEEGPPQGDDEEDVVDEEVLSQASTVPMDTSDFSDGSITAADADNSA
jgi:hypothetical protein